MCEEKLSYWLVYNYLSNAPPNINAPPKAKGGALYQNKGYLPNKNRDFDTMRIEITVLVFCLYYGLFQLF